MKRISQVFCAAIVCAALLASPVAIAKNNKGNGGHGNGKPHASSSHDDKRGGSHGGSDRDILRDYVIGHYKRHCPPGLAKKNPPCIPPGQAKKYRVGSFLPENSYVRVPRDVVELLVPPPSYARYVRVDKNVYLITEGTRKVIEAIELFSQVD